jgi:hypothetical protein
MSDADDDQIIETDALFSRPFRTLFGRKRHSWLTHRPKLTYTVLVGRNVTTDTQTLDSIIFLNASSVPVLRVAGGGVGTVAAADQLSGWATLAVGEYGHYVTGNVAGNASATLPSVAPTGNESVFELLQLLITLENDATVASRIINCDITTGLLVETGSPFSQTIQIRTVGPTVTASQEGSLLLTRAGQGATGINTNGAPTQGTTSPLPILLGDSGTVTSLITAGVAGDFHRLSAFVRRVA